MNPLFGESIAIAKLGIYCVMFSYFHNKGEGKSYLVIFTYVAYDL